MLLLTVLLRVLMCVGECVTGDLAASGSPIPCFAGDPSGVGCVCAVACVAGDLACVDCCVRERVGVGFVCAPGEVMVTVEGTRPGSASTVPVRRA